jgi:hypothetical protein
MEDRERVVVLVREVDYGSNTTMDIDPGFHPEIYAEGEVVVPADLVGLREELHDCYYLEHYSPRINAGDLVVLERSDQDHTWPKNDLLGGKKVLWKIVR